MPICKSCKKSFPNKMVIDGKERTLNSRKYCIKCSPFGLNNRRKIEIRGWRGQENPCKNCGKPVIKALLCNTCTSRKRRGQLRHGLYDIVGDNCPICGYGGRKYRKVMVLHHIKPEDKLFSLCVSGLSKYSWYDVLTEARKCAVLCPNHHTELHYGLLSKENLRRVTPCKVPEELLLKSKPGARKEKPKKYCLVCGKRIGSNAKHCSYKCHGVSMRKPRPTKGALEKEIKSTTWVALGKKYKVSDNAVRKWAKKYGLL